jgi:hypothetical protein
MTAIQPQDFELVPDEDMIRTLAGLSLPDLVPDPEKEFARRYTPGVMCTRSYNNGKQLYQSRPLPEYKADLFAKSDWFCMACSKTAAENEKKHRTGKGTRTFQLKFFDDGLIIGSAVCKDCARHARNIGRSGPLRNIRTEKQLMHLYTNFKNKVEGLPPKYPDCLPITDVQPLEPITNIDGFVNELSARISEVAPEPSKKKKHRHHHHRHRDRSPKRKEKTPEPTLKWTPEELEDRIAAIRDGPEIPGTTKGLRINQLRMQQHGFGALPPPPPLPRAPEPEPELPSEPRFNLPRGTKTQAMEKLQSLHKTDELVLQRISEFNAEKQDSGSVTDAPVPPPVVVKSADRSAIVKCVLGMVDNPVDGESLRDGSLWRDLIPELRKCQPADWVHFQDTHPEVWNIFWIVKRFRFLSLSNLASMAASLYKTSRDLLASVRPNISGAPLVLEEVNRVQTLCLSYINCVLDGDDLLAIGWALNKNISKLCGLTEDMRKTLDRRYLCQQLRQLLVTEKQMGVGLSLAKFVRPKKV